MDNRRVIIHDEPHPDNQGKYGRLRMVTTTEAEIHYWPCPYTDPQIAKDRRIAKQGMATRGRLSKLERIALDRGGSVTDLPKRGNNK